MLTYKRFLMLTVTFFKRQGCQINVNNVVGLIMLTIF